MSFRPSRPAGDLTPARLTYPPPIRQNDNPADPGSARPAAAHGRSGTRCGWHGRCDPGHSAGSHQIISILGPNPNLRPMDWSWRAPPRTQDPPSTGVSRRPRAKPWGAGRGHRAGRAPRDQGFTFAVMASMGRWPRRRSTSMCTCRPPTGWTAAWRGTWRRRGRTSAPRCRGGRWRALPPRTPARTCRRACRPWGRRPPPAAPGGPRVPNETVAEACRGYPDTFTGLGSVDPHKGDAAVAEVANIAALGLRGVKFHPSLQAFAPDDPAFWPVFAACERHGLLA